jgi:hypothetical protein
VLDSISMGDILDSIQYKPGWSLVCSLPATTNTHAKPYVKWTFEAPDLHTGEPELQHCRKWQLSYYMTSSEVVRTVWKAALAAEEHEAAEAFTYKGARIYHPHADLEALADAVNAGDVGEDYRKEQ